jgi:hypothetical protein
VNILLQRYTNNVDHHPMLLVGKPFLITWGTSTRTDAGVPESAHTARFIHPAIQTPLNSQQPPPSPCDSVTSASEASEEKPPIEGEGGGGGGGGGVEGRCLEAGVSFDSLDEDHGVNLDGIGLLKHGGFLFYDMDENIVGLSEMAKHGKDNLCFDPCITMPMHETDAYLGSRWCTSSLFTQQFLSSSHEALLNSKLTTASESKGKFWSTWVYPAENVNNKKPTRFGGLAILFQPDLDWKPQHNFCNEKERLKEWHVDEILELEKRNGSSRDAVVFIFPLSSNHSI